jgi:pimeloyl-ACP methyl ester carboxylesterase
MVIGLWLFGLRMACRFPDGIAGLVVIEPGGILLESVIMFSSCQEVDTSVVVGLGRDVVVPSVAVVVPNDESIANLY